jgi:hypothetical protein
MPDPRPPATALAPAGETETPPLMDRAAEAPAAVASADAGVEALAAIRPAPAIARDSAAAAVAGSIAGT